MKKNRFEFVEEKENKKEHFKPFKEQEKTMNKEIKLSLVKVVRTFLFIGIGLAILYKEMALGSFNGFDLGLCLLAFWNCTK